MAPVESLCTLCQKTFKKNSPSDVDLCPECLSTMESRYMSKPEPPPKPPFNWRPIQWAVILLGLLIMALRFPALVEMGEPLKPLRIGTAPTDALADDCLRNLWRASFLIQEGKWPPENEPLLCPATQQPYLTRPDGDDVEISCPNPSAHRLRALRVRKSAPVPEVLP